MKRDIPVCHVPFTPLDELLNIWASFQRRDDNRDSGGYRGRDAVCRSDAQRDSEQLFDAADEDLARAVDNCIHSLSAQHAWAIKKRCNIAGVWRFPALDFESTLGKAEIALDTKFRENPTTAAFLLSRHHEK